MRHGHRHTSYFSFHLYLVLSKQCIYKCGFLRKNVRKIGLQERDVFFPHKHITAQAVLRQHVLDTLTCTGSFKMFDSQTASHKYNLIRKVRTQQWSFFSWHQWGRRCPCYGDMILLCVFPGFLRLRHLIPTHSAYFVLWQFTFSQCT